MLELNTNQLFVMPCAALREQGHGEGTRTRGGTPMGAGSVKRSLSWLIGEKQTPPAVAFGGGGWRIR